MVFAVYEQGMRIHTPADKMLNRPEIQAAAAISAQRRLADEASDMDHLQQMAEQPFFRLNPSLKEREEHNPNHGQEAIKAYAKAEEALDTHTSDQKRIPAYQVMHSPVVFASTATSLNQGWRLMQDNQVSFLPLLDQEERVVGVISEVDLLREAAGVGRLLTRDNASQAKDLKLGDFIIEPLISAVPNTDIRDIARLMLERHIAVMPILDDEKLVGIITRKDLLLGLVNEALDLMT
ncbi:CBS domain-containing protein [Allopseudospirillum japonicum]|uniref:CBS domain-containing protein n=1 Tax=Allopseudospirillum japonicum TaxID=64971 RepID=A0A1H6QSN6_9GAMM|nr:CBS domain-containing protein [Allopseudospirillum japonicum]SEI42012.1 CBS domain-containing protein [Allopseudospirillum japonicum]